MITGTKLKGKDEAKMKNELPFLIPYLSGMVIGV